jgi:hypothetical protein
MKNVKQMLAMGFVAVVVALAGAHLAAQDAKESKESKDSKEVQDADNGPDPAIVHPKRMERIRQQLEVKGADEWKIVEARVARVMEAEHGMSLNGSLKKRLAKRELPPGYSKKSKHTAEAGGLDSLQEAIDSSASATDLKTTLEKYHQVRRERLAKLEKAQDDLRKVLTIRQEIQAILLGLLE